MQVAPQPSHLADPISSMTHSSSNTGQCREDGAKLKIGLMVDSASASAGICDLVKWCRNQDTLAISHFLLVGKPPNWRRAFSSKCFSWMTKLEILLMRSRNLHVAAADQDLSTLVPDVIAVDPAGTEWHGIKALQLDILLIASPGAIPDGICHAAKLGAIRICYGHAGPVGFWEVFFKRDYTGFSLRHLSGGTKAEVDLISGQIATQYCQSLNKTRIEQKSLHYARQLLSSISLDRKIPNAAHTASLPESANAMPGPLIQAAYLCMFCFRQVHRAIRSAFRLDFKWSVAYQKRGWQAMEMADAIKIKRPEGHFLADPFVVSEGGRDYCFLEDYDFSTAKGHVAVYQLHQDEAECLGNALVEPFHLSFPYMFRYKSELYMCPETSRNRQIRVYKCVNFPLQWRLHTVLMDDVSAADTMLFEQGGRWWMLTNRDVAETGDYCTELSIYWADSPLSNTWTAHPMNPVFIDAAKGRNAGLLFDASHIYRVAQKQGFERYGKAFSINRIDRLDENSYRETEIRSVQADFFPGINGTHHMHGNGTSTVFDYI